MTNKIKPTGFKDKDGQKLFESDVLISDNFNEYKIYYSLTHNQWRLFSKSGITLALNDYIHCLRLHYHGDGY